MSSWIGEAPRQVPVEEQGLGQGLSQGLSDWEWASSLPQSRPRRTSLRQAESDSAASTGLQGGEWLLAFAPPAPELDLLSDFPSPRDVPQRDPERRLEP